MGQEGDRLAVLRAEIDWLLPGCLLEQMRERADGGPRTFWKETDGRLKAKVETRDGRSHLAARVVRLRQHQTSFTLRADLTQEGTGVRVRGYVPRVDSVSIALGFGLLALAVGLAVRAVVTRGLLDPLALVFTALAAGGAGASRGMAASTRARYRQELLELEGKVRSRFCDFPTSGLPWMVEPAEGTGHRPLKPQPMIRFGGRNRQPRR